MSLLTIIQSAAVRIGVPSPQSVVGNTDPSVAALLEFANEEGQELASRTNWETLTKEHSFTTIAATVQASAIPPDFDRFVKDTMFNRTSQQRVYGPVSAEAWQKEKASVVAAAIRNFFRIRGGDLLLTPNPPAGQEVYYEYVSKNWVSGDKSAMDADTDESLLPEKLIVLGIRWRFKKDRGIAYDQDYITYQNEVAKVIGRDGGAPNLTLGNTRSSLGNPNVPETGFGP